MRAGPFAVIAACALAVASCGKDSTTTAPTTPTSPTTSVFASHLAVGGAASRTFTTSQSGTITLTLDSADNSPTLGIGLGIPYGGVSNCTLSTSVLTRPGATAQLTMPVDSATYCATVFDPGTLGQSISFQMTIVFP